ncbi:MAG TPA: response regulator [Terriglobia bacterium]|nr:response regulator [Terriglobia bacterium]
MDEKIKTVMIYDQHEPSDALRQVLRRLGMEVRHVHTCQEASRLLKQPDSAEMVFTDTTLPDGTWEDVLRLAQQSHDYLPVIVVSRVVDIDLYLEALESGAFDLVAPPFLSYDLANVTGSAMYKKLVSRELQPTPRA